MSDFTVGQLIAAGVQLCETRDALAGAVRSSVDKLMIDLCDFGDEEESGGTRVTEDPTGESCLPRNHLPNLHAAGLMTPENTFSEDVRAVAIYTSDIDEACDIAKKAYVSMGQSDLDFTLRRFRVKFEKGLEIGFENLQY